MAGNHINMIIFTMGQTSILFWDQRVPEKTNAFLIPYRSGRNPLPASTMRKTAMKAMECKNRTDVRINPIHRNKKTI